MKTKPVILLFGLCISWLSPTFANTHVQRGSKLFMDNCSGCHSLEYFHYNRMTEASNTKLLTVAMPTEDAKHWFGVVPPDLSLVARARGASWIYYYLTGFYKDTSRPFGANNSLFLDVAMPEPTITDSQAIQDLVDFLVYVGEPNKAVRYKLGIFVEFFLCLLLMLVFFLYKSYWKKSSKSES